MTSRPPPRTSITRSRRSVRTSRNSMSERPSRRKTVPFPPPWNQAPVGRQRNAGLASLSEVLILKPTWLSPSFPGLGTKTPDVRLPPSSQF